MLDLESAIKHCEEVMMENLKKTKDRNASDPIAINCFECAEEHRQLAEWLKNYKRLKEQEHCDNCVSRQQAIDKMQELEEEDIEAYGCSIPEGFDGKRAIEALKALSSVHTKTKVGRWIYDKNIDNWKCSECGETPKTMGYCGSADFMAKHFKYCNHCGAKMQEVEDA